MKVIVQIPCLNEEQTLHLVLSTIPKKIPGVDSIEVLIIDDGSTDKTVEVAKKYGVQHFVTHARPKGLARSFHDGVLRALELGADIIVNTDGDNQYPQERITDLVQPIINKRADIVIADRQIKKIEHFSLGKKIMQKVGTKILNLAAGTHVPDAPSGFRAYSRDAIMQLNVVTKFSYAMETIIQAGNKRLTIESLPIETNPKTRESRLFKNSFEHIRKSGSAIIRAFIMYRPYFLFVTLGIILFLAGIFPVGRFLYFFIFKHSESVGHQQSLILGSVLLIGAFLSFAMGVIADLIRINRTLVEEMLEQLKHTRFDKK
jgi:glycosyltransferase involved in cell wall biosynthesis